MNFVKSSLCSESTDWKHPFISEPAQPQLMNQFTLLLCQQVHCNVEVCTLNLNFEEELVYRILKINTKMLEKWVFVKIFVDFPK